MKASGKPYFCSIILHTLNTYRKKRFKDIDVLSLCATDLDSVTWEMQWILDRYTIFGRWLYKLGNVPSWVRIWAPSVYRYFPQEAKHALLLFSEIIYINYRTYPKSLWPFFKNSSFFCYGANLQGIHVWSWNIPIRRTHNAWKIRTCVRMYLCKKLKLSL